MEEMKKRGLSMVITVVLLILLVLIAVGIIWVVVKNIVKSSSEEITLGKITVDISLSSVQVETGNIKAKVKRGSGKADVTGLKFAIYDGTETNTVDLDVDLGELEEKTFNVPYDGIVKEVSVAPIIKSSSGKSILGRSSKEIEFSNKEALENLGAVSWWKLDSGVEIKDEYGTNNGINNGAIFTNSGKYNGAYNFDGVDDYINISKDSAPHFASNQAFTVAAWIKADACTGYCAIMGQGQSDSAEEILLAINSGLELYFDWGIGGSRRGGQVNLNQWHHVVGRFNADPDTGDIFIDGNKIENPAGGNSLHYDPNTFDLSIGQGRTNNFSGTIDEVMIFNKALTAEQVKDLKKLDLS